MPLTRDWRDLAATALATLLLALFWWQAVSASFEKSHTSDELPHITAGYAYDRFQDFRIQPENGVLPQRLFGIPALIEGVHFPMTDLDWRRSLYWGTAWDYFYASGNPTEWLVLTARALNALFGVALGVFIYLVARRWAGRGSGLLALAYFAFCPNFLAHAALATSDLAIALFLVLAPWFFWRHLDRRTVMSGLLAGLVSGLALTAKHSGILLAPMYLLLAAAEAWTALGWSARLRRFAANLGLAVVQAVAATAVIWAFFCFRYDPRGPGTPPFEAYAWTWSEMYALLGIKANLIQWARAVHLLPEAYLYGLTNTLAGATSRPAFLAGEYSEQGWWQFFPTVFLAKTTLGLLAASLLAVVSGTIGLQRLSTPEPRVWWHRLAPLVVSAGVVWIVALSSKLNIGHRHILAVYPVLFVATGLLAAPGSPWPRATALAGVLFLGMEAAESFSVRPHYLAFFNRAVGGPEHGYRLVVDSSLDWGQDLPALHRWIESNRRPGEPLYLSFFGSAWPHDYGVHAVELPSINVSHEPPQWHTYEPGLYCISATMLWEVYQREKGPWTAEREQRYRALLAASPQLALTVGSPAGAALPAVERRQQEQDYGEFDRLRFSRLCRYLRGREPDASAGYSILIYRLSAAELRAALAPR
ncbi:MAG: glycosyltransferase family 39 protein [Opitutaceae bacterium]|nr:glycosyltransferase family 39 protein [Opitutaceae bacterium]